MKIKKSPRPFSIYKRTRTLKFPCYHLYSQPVRTGLPLQVQRKRYSWCCNVHPSVTAYSLLFGVKLREVFICQIPTRLSSAGCFLSVPLQTTCSRLCLCLIQGQYTNPACFCQAMFRPLLQLTLTQCSTDTLRFLSFRKNLRSSERKYLSQWYLPEYRS